MVRRRRRWRPQLHAPWQARGAGAAHVVPRSTDAPSASRKRRRLVLALLALLAVGGSRRAWAGPWIPGRWHFYLQLRQSVMIADRRYDAGGDLRAIAVALADGSTAPARYRQALSSLYFELGLGARLALFLDWLALDYVVQVASSRPDRSAFGVSDLRLGAKLLLFDDELTATLQAAVVAPTGSPTTAVPLGPGDVRAEFTLLVGKIFDRPRLHLAAELGVRVRSSATIADPSRPGALIVRQYSHELVYRLTVGYTRLFARRGVSSLVFAARVEGGYAFLRPTEDGLGILVPEAASYTKLGPEITWAPYPSWQVSLGGHYFVAGRAIPAMGELALGLAYLR